MKKCLLCVQPAEAQAPWDLEWDKKCTESICDLLTLELTDYLIFFENVAYCRPCHEFVRDIDFTMRTLTLFKEKTLELRSILSQKLLPHFEAYFSAERDDCSINPSTTESDPDSKAKRKSARIAAKQCAETEKICVQYIEDTRSSVGSEAEEDVSPDWNQIPIEIDVKEESPHTESCTETEDEISDTQSNFSSISEFACRETPTRLQNQQILTILDLKDEDDDSDVNHEHDSRCSPTPLAEDAQGSTVVPEAIAENTSGCRRSLRNRKKPATYQAETGADVNNTEPDLCTANETEYSESETDESESSESFSSGTDTDSEVEDVVEEAHQNIDLATVNRILIKILNPDQTTNPPASLLLPKKTVASAIRKRINNYRERIRPRRKRIRKSKSSRRESTAKATNAIHLCGINDCSFEAESADWLHVHKAEHRIAIKNPDSDNTSPCTICNLNFTKENMKGHMDRVHRPTTGLPTQIQCPGCSEQFGDGKVGKSTFKQFRHHFKARHVQQYTCPIEDCDTFGSSATLAQHTRKFHENEAEKFNCRVCNFTFFLSSEYTAHEELHQPDEFICVLGYCYRKSLVNVNPSKSTEFENADELQAHVKKKHSPQSVLKCGKCTFTTMNKTYLEVHTDQIHSEIRASDKYICGINSCTFEAESSDWLSVHKMEHRTSAKNGTSCFICKINFNEEDLKFHIDRVHRPTTGIPTCIQCPGCSKKFGKGVVGRKQFYEFHLHFKGIHVAREPEIDTRRFPYLCPVRDCRSRSRTTELLAVHTRKCHENDPKPFKCDNCPQAFKSRSYLNTHKTQKHNVPVAVCHLCGQSFPTHILLNYHISRKHPDAEKYYCDICSAKFNFSGDCQSHQALHKAGSFICVLGKCYGPYWRQVKLKSLKDFGSLENLREHVEEGHQQHQTGKGKLIYCDKCTYSCRFAPSLEMHMTKHSKEKPFQCKTCKKCFKSKLTLDEHEENKHPDPNNMKVYQCKLCPDTFHSRQFLSRHNYWHKHGSIAKPLPGKKVIPGDDSGSSSKRKRKITTNSEFSNTAHDGDDSTSENVKKKRRIGQRKRKVVVESDDSESEDQDCTKLDSNPDQFPATEVLSSSRRMGLRERPKKCKV